MKLLAIHSNKLFFKKEAVNFYSWLANQRGLVKEYSVLKKEYDEGKKGPLVLKETYELTVGNLTQQELYNYCKQYNELYFNEAVIDKLKQVIKGVSVMVFTSYPRELYEHLLSKGLAEKIFGVEGTLNAEEKISGFKEIDLKNAEVVKEKMEAVDFADKFNMESNRYGLLELLIDEIIFSNLSKDDIIVLGTGSTAKPMHKVAGKVINNLEET